MLSAEQRTDTLNRLLRGELSAIETYHQAMQMMSRGQNALDLRRIEEDHLEAVHVLRQHISQRGANPANGSGAWGIWAKTVEGTAKLFGNSTALKALKEGEEHGVKEYEKALEDQYLDVQCQTLIRSDLLPRSRQHIPALDRLINAQ